MTGVFGEVADVYDRARPGYPAEIASSIVAYHGAEPAHVVEVGAGTGKGTEVLLRLGAPMTCLEPDPRMAAVLTARFPQLDVHVGDFERWTPPPGGVPVIGCALAWHWLDPLSRNHRAYAALVPGGTLAVFGHTYGFADPAHAAAIGAALKSVDPSVTERAETWARDDIAGSGLFVDVASVLLRRPVELAKAQYLELLQTFGPYRTKPPALRARALAAVGSVLDAIGGAVVLDLRTTLVLARRPDR